MMNKEKERKKKKKTYRYRAERPRDILGNYLLNGNTLSLYVTFSPKGSVASLKHNGKSLEEVLDDGNCM